MHFEQPGYVSVWVGQFGSSDAFQDYIELIFDDAGNAESQFGRDAHLDGLGHAAHEAMSYPDGIADLCEELAKYSFGNSFAEQVAAEIEAQGLLPIDAIFLLFDCAYPADLVNDQQQLWFVGAFPYHE